MSPSNNGESDPFQIFEQIFGPFFGALVRPQPVKVQGPAPAEPANQGSDPGHREPIDKPVQTELDLVQVRRLDSLRPAPENDDVYQPIAYDDPEILELARSIKEHGIQEPILISHDGFIISGHRRRIAAAIAELELVPVRVHPVSRSENRDEFLRLLVEMNSQRIKNTSELLHESLIKVDPEEAHQQIVSQREEKSQRTNGLNAIEPGYGERRCEISAAKRPFLDAVLRILEEQRDYWPLSDRQIHYRLLGPDAPLTHASKPDSTYVNDKASYRKLVDLLSRGRINGLINWEAIEDVTRPVSTHSAYRSVPDFFRDQFKDFLKGYWRNRQQSQPNHVEIVAEKLTVQTILEAVAEEFTIPLTITRGMSSLPPKKDIQRRFWWSRKRKLILLVVSDLDPAGDAIAEDLVKSFRRDFSIYKIEAYKVALTIDQVQEFGLEPSMEAKDTSPTYAAFVEKYGITDAYELEAMDPADLAQTLRDAITEVLDLDLYNQEIATEKADSGQIIAVQKQAQQFFQSLSLDEPKS
jgi:hypothetical protein